MIGIDPHDGPDTYGEDPWAKEKARKAKQRLGEVPTRELLEELRLRGDLAMTVLPTSERGADGAVLSALAGVVLKSCATETLEANRGQ